MVINRRETTNTAKRVIKFCREDWRGGLAGFISQSSAITVVFVQLCRSWPPVWLREMAGWWEFSIGRASISLPGIWRLFSFGECVAMTGNLFNSGSLGLQFKLLPSFLTLQLVWERGQFGYITTKIYPPINLNCLGAAVLRVQSQIIPKSSTVASIIVCKYTNTKCNWTTTISIKVQPIVQVTIQS